MMVSFSVKFRMGLVCRSLKSLSTTFRKKIKIYFASLFCNSWLCLPYACCIDDSLWRTFPEMWGKSVFFAKKNHCLEKATAQRVCLAWSWRYPFDAELSDLFGHRHVGAAH